MTTELILRKAERLISRMEGEPVTLSYRKQKPLRMEDIKRALCEATGFSWEEILTKRGRGFTLPKQLFCYLCAKKLGLGCVYIARQLNHDPTTVNHNKHLIQSFLDVGDDATTMLYSKVLERL